MHSSIVTRTMENECIVVDNHQSNFQSNFQRRWEPLSDDAFSISEWFEEDSEGYTDMGIHYGVHPIPSHRSMALDAQSASALDIDEAMKRLGTGPFQYQILVAAGLCLASDAMEVLLLSYLSAVLSAEWGLKGNESDDLISVVFLGGMFGTLTLSPLGDLVGRRPVFLLTAVTIAVFGVATAFCNNFETLLCARFMVGFGVGGVVVPFDTMVEYLPAESRGSVLLYLEFFWIIGTLLVPIFTWMGMGVGIVGHGEFWRLLCIFCAIPCIFSSVLTFFLVPESPRWLLTRGKPEKAMVIIRHAAKKNGLDPDTIFPNGCILTQDEAQKTETSALLDLFSQQWLRTTLFLWITWFGLAFSHYGAILASSMVLDYGMAYENGGSYVFDIQTIIVTVSSEFLGLVLALITIDRWGRVPTQLFTYLLAGMSCLLFGWAAHFEQSRAVLAMLSFVARSSLMGATCTTWVFTSEILTTDIRATGHGYANAMARMGGCFIPHVISDDIPFYQMGLFLFLASCISATALSRLPETSGQRLGASVHQDKSVGNANDTDTNVSLDLYLVRPNVGFGEDHLLPRRIA